MAERRGFLFPQLDECRTHGREGHSVVANLDGTLLRSRSSFPYYALVAYDVGGPLRLLCLLLASPLAAILYYCVSESASIQLLIFAIFVGVKVVDIELAARAVLPKYYSEDVHSGTWAVFCECRGLRCVLTATPRIMVEPFLREYLRVDVVKGTEISTCRGRATGFVRRTGVLVGENKAAAVVEEFEEESPNVGLGDRETDYPFMRLCQRRGQERYLVPATEVVAVPLTPIPPNQVAALRHDQIRSVMFHDGRLVQKPTPLVALIILIWIPFGFLLAVLRIGIGRLLPMRFVFTALFLLGVRITSNGETPFLQPNIHGGVLFVCSHRTLLDPVFLSIVLRRRIPAIAYSISRLSEILSPIPAVHLSRRRDADATILRTQLATGDLVICPEGTTCREHFLLRFSALFAELPNQIVPVAIKADMGMFYGTSARKGKWMDSIYFFMNPLPVYELTFLPMLLERETVAGGRTSIDVANDIQTRIEAKLDYVCTTITREDKYRILTGNDGTVLQ